MAGHTLKQLTSDMLDDLVRQAKNSPRLRANSNLHEALSEPVQRLAIAMEPETFVRPHRHPGTWELLIALRGRFVVLLFDEAGRVTQRTVLGRDCHVIELPAGTWHAVRSLDPGGVIFEVKQGPYAPVPEADFAPWCGTGEGDEAARLNAWYVRAQPGDRL